MTVHLVQGFSNYRCNFGFAKEIGLTNQIYPKRICKLQKKLKIRPAVNIFLLHCYE